MPQLQIEEGGVDEPLLDDPAPKRIVGALLGTWRILLGHSAPSRIASVRVASAWVQKLAERVGFEPTCRLPDKTLSRRPRYDHFGTSPRGEPFIIPCRTDCRIAGRRYGVGTMGTDPGNT
jgi:hypothetical protein